MQLYLIIPVTYVTKEFDVIYYILLNYKIFPKIDVVMRPSYGPIYLSDKNIQKSKFLAILLNTWSILVRST